VADIRMIARLVDSPEFRELAKHIKEREEEDVKTLARKTYKLPEHHDGLEWEKLKARYAGAFDVLGLPAQARKQLEANREESH
jgi:chromatin segregation and condensation protein Rec8/ScpA/Scc1 (kleisin family)